MIRSDTQQHNKLCKLFKLLNQAELKSQNVQRHSIVLMGLSRSGKSAVTNWLFDPSSMVGKKIGINVFYVPTAQVEQNNVEQALKMAKIGHGFASVTIMANMRVSDIDRKKVAQQLAKEQKEAEDQPESKHSTKSVSLNEAAEKKSKCKGQVAAEMNANPAFNKYTADQTKISFLDFGGFGERRDVVQILKVNYVLAAFLLKMQKIKFVLVITQHSFKDISSNGLRDTFGEFLRLFNFQMMSEKEKTNFFKSVSLCITSISKEYSDQDIVEQLRIILSNFADDSLLDGQKNQNTYIQKFQICKRLLQELIDSRRFQLFPLAIDRRHPSQSKMVQNLNAKKWEYFSLKISKYQVCFPYVEQFYRLKEEERTKMSDIIFEKFRINQQISNIINHMVYKFYDNIFEDALDLEEQMAQIKNLLDQNQIYEDMPSNFPDDNQATAYLNWLIRIQSLIQLYQLNNQLLPFQTWKAQNTNPNGQQNDMNAHGQLINYYGYLAKCFERNMIPIKTLFGRISWHRNSLNKVLFVFKKAINEALIFQNLNHDIYNIFHENFDLGSQIRFKIKDSLSFGNSFADSVAKIKFKVLEQLGRQKVKQQKITSCQALQIINTVDLYLKTLKDVDTLQAYSICYQYSLIAAKGAVRQDQALKYLIRGLEYCVRQQVCLQIYMQKAVLINLKGYQQYIINQLFSVLGSQNRDLYPNLFEIIRRLKIYQIQNKQKKERYELISIQALMQTISLVKIQAFGQQDIIPVNIQFQRNKYTQIKKILLKDKTFMKAQPKNPNNYQLLSQSNELLKHTVGKKITVMIKLRPNRGQTTLAYALTNSTLAVEKKDNHFRYELLNLNDSKINHQDNPTLYPHLRSIEENQILVDFPTLNQIDVDKKVITSIVLQKLLKNSSEFRFMLVQSEKDLLQNNGIQLIKTIKTVATLFRDQIMKEQCKIPTFLKSVYLAFTFTADSGLGSQNSCLKKIHELRNKFSQKSKMAELQIYSVDQRQKLAIQAILTALHKANSRIVFFNKANQEQTFKKADWIAQLQEQMFNCTECKGLKQRCSHKWSYQDKKSCLKQNISQLIIKSTFLPIQIQSFTSNIKAKIDKLTAIFNDIFERIEQSFKALLSNHPLSQQIQSTEKLLICLKSLYRIKYFFLSYQGYQVIFLPHDYSKYYQMIRIFKNLLISHIKQSCPQSYSQQQLSQKDQTINVLFEELQNYSQNLGSCGINQINENLNQIKIFQSNVQGFIGNNYFDQLSKCFIQFVPLKFILGISAEQPRKDLLHHYNEVSKAIKEHQGRQGQLLGIKILIIKQICDNAIHSQRNQLPDTGVMSQFEKSRQLLREIGEYLLCKRPQISEEICLAISSPELLSLVYQKNYQRSIYNYQKIDLMAKRIDLALQMNWLEKARTLYSQIYRLRPHDELLSIDGIRQYARRNHLNQHFPPVRRIETIEQLITYVQHLKKQIF